MKLEKSESGHDIVFFEGKYMSSKRDPIREAQKWVESLRPIIGGLDTLIVLGLGSGYKISELFIRYPKLKVIVIETDKALIEAVKEIQSKINLLNTNFVHCMKNSDLLSSHQIIEAVKLNYSVIGNNFLIRQNQIINIDTMDFLNGRSFEGLQWVCRIRKWSSLPLQFNQDSVLLSAKDLLLSSQCEDLDIDLRRSISIVNELIR